MIGHVTWQGRPVQPNAFQQLPITLTLKSGTAEYNFPVQTTDASGFFTTNVNLVPAGTYSWRVKGTKYLASSGNVVLAGGTTRAEFGLMLSGDCNDDNIVNILDSSILKNSYGKVQGDAGYDDRADLTGDAVVNITDFNLLRQNFGMVGTPPL